jgi:hypothetical protein
MSKNEVGLVMEYEPKNKLPHNNTVGSILFEIAETLEFVEGGGKVTQ